MKYLDMTGLTTFWGKTKEYVDKGDKYVSTITDTTLKMPNAVGGISAGTTVATLNNKTVNQLLDDLLFPTIYPTFTAPSASISFSNYTGTQEVGAAGPTSTNFTTTYNAGQITLNGVKQNDRGGSLKSAESFIYVNDDTSNKTLPATVALGNTTFKYRASYAQGPQPVDNKGVDYGTPLIAGVVDSKAITLNGTYPWYASTSSATSDNPVVKQSLVSWNSTAGKMSTGNFTLQATGSLDQVFMLPRKITELQMLNTFSGKMEVTSTSDYTETSGNFIEAHPNHTYYKYTYTGAGRGEVTLLAKF